MYAIINISGKQFKVSKGQKTRVPKQKGDAGDTITFNNVLFLKDDTSTHLGDPILSNASVTATILEHKRSKKILVYKKKRRKGYQRKNGHRQWYTEIEFNKINVSKIKNNKQKKKPVIQESLQEEE
mgnify:FL=1